MTNNNAAQDNNNNNNNAAIVIDDAATDNAARKFAAAWDTSATGVYNTAVHARTLKESGLKGDEIVDLLRAAIAERQAIALGVTTQVAIADIAGGVKISNAAVSQLATALTRVEECNLSAANNKPLVKAFYDAAVSGVKSADLKDIVKFASELDADVAAWVTGELAEQRALAGRAKKRAAAERKQKANADAADSADAADAGNGNPVKNGQPTFTIAEILRAAAECDRLNNGTSVSAAAMQIAELLAN